MVSNLLPERPCAAPDRRLRPGFGRGHREEGEGQDGRRRRGGGRDSIPRRVDGVRSRIHRDAQVEPMALASSATLVKFMNARLTSLGNDGFQADVARS